MRERRAVEDVRVGFQLLEDDLPVSNLLLVERLVGAYVGDERHGGIVAERNDVFGSLTVRLRKFISLTQSVENVDVKIDK